MKILFIGSRLFDDISWYVRENNITSIITESNKDADNLELADKVYIVNRGMDEPFDIALKEDVDAVVPLIGIDPPLTDVGKLKDKLETDYNIPVIASSYYTANLAADKFETKKLLEANNIKTPYFKKIKDDNISINIDNTDVDLPVVLKTPNGQAGRGVKIAQNIEDYDSFIEENSTVFSEEFITGPDVSIEVLRHHNKSVALTPVYKADTTLSGTHPLSKVKQAPLEIDGINNKTHNENLRKLAIEIADLVKLDGTMDIDILHDTDKNEDYVIELNTRPSGTRYITAATSDVYPLCQLVDMATGNWNPRKLQKDIKNYYAAEIPVGDFPIDKKIPEKKVFETENSYIVHGPKHYERVTLRSPTRALLDKLSRNLIPTYLKENNISFN